MYDINGEQAVKLPEKGSNILRYENFHKQQPAPFVIYADFEAITEKSMAANLITIHHSLIYTKSTLTAGLDIKLFVVTTTNTPHQFKFTKVKRPFISF